LHRSLSRRAPLGLGIAVATVAWIAAAASLWRTSVPDLTEPSLDAHRLFGAALLDRAARFEGVVRLLYVLSEVALVLALVVYARRGHRLMRESAAGPIGTGMLLGMLGLGILWLVQLPFTVVEHWWGRRYDVAEGGYVDLIFEGWLELVGAFLFICLALLIVMGLASAMGERWWIPGAAVFVGLAIVFAWLTPYLTVSEKLGERDPALAAEAQRLEEVEGVEGVPVNVEDVSSTTTAPNAWAGGLGDSEAVFLWDTLLDGRFSDDQVAVVLGHELGHLAHDHIWKSVGWYALFALPGAYLIARSTRRYGGMADPRAVPVGLLVLVVLQLAATPFQNVVSRRLEREADWSALEATRDPDAARELFEQFTRTTLSQPDPPRWAVVLFATHPPDLDRIELAEAWKRREAAR
jgi:Zn-dependent protease with chaperone function